MLIIDRRKIGKQLLQNVPVYFEQTKIYFDIINLLPCY